ncbi:PREDICTED: 2'-5'-oligoadenylate synthase-like protein [Elephantulus edwardii]|uniref:2'-5'-oligoadenylate synthase-like protein n=1 Tax=Elephantulus edwardii TaxID=28737 RepID=UPI0003F07E0C|nr:PREDICTED: 2'-5'-oligoadenylate synthase-like protein [Elephantulus edwardii]
MAVAQELFGTPSSKLDGFVVQWLQPSREWKEKVTEVVRAMEQALRSELLQMEYRLDPKVQVQKVVKAGSFGNGTIIRGFPDVELVVFLSGLQSFQEEATYHDPVLKLIQKKLKYCQDLWALGLNNAWLSEDNNKLIFIFQPGGMLELLTITVVPAFRALGPLVPNVQPPPDVYVSLIKTHGDPGRFSPTFSELQRNFVKHRPTKLKSLMRLVKHWYLQYVKAKCPKAFLPPLYALELLTIYVWEMGTEENEYFRLDEGFTSVMELLQAYEFICIYWTKYYGFQNPVIETFVRNQLKKERPIILDPADPTHNVAEGYRWDIVAERASQCLKQDCCYDTQDNPVPSWNVKRARDIQVTVEQDSYVDLTLWADPYEPIWKIMKKICQRQGHSGSLRLSFQEPGGERQLLSGHRSLASYGLFSRLRIYLLETFYSEIQVFVKNPDGESHAYAINPNSITLDLKDQIQDKLGMPREQQQLMLRGQILQNWLYLTSYGLRDSDTLILSRTRENLLPLI